MPFGIRTRTPEEKSARNIVRERARAERAIADREAAARRHEARVAYETAERKARAERFEAMPHFVVREAREVTVKAENIADAISLAAAAFKDGQDDDYTIKWHKPFGVEGDTVDKIRVINIKAIEQD